MSLMEKEMFYWSRYLPTILYSLAYMMLIAYSGIWIILKRESLFGLVLTSFARVAFVIGFGLNEILFEVQKTSNFAKLDIFFFPITLLFVFLTVMALRTLKEADKSAETFLAILLVTATALIPLLHKVFHHTDVAASHTFFSDLLYTDPKLLQYYFWPSVLMAVGMLFFYRPFKLIIFDADQAYLSGLATKQLEFLFYFFVGIVTAICVRIMGIYLAMAAMLIPAYFAITVSRTLKGVLIFCFLLVFISLLLGFSFAFYADTLPTEPVLILSFLFCGAVVYVVSLMKRVG
ncbi:MAG: hypothetical protein D6767_00110 [Candidatus Hydrogenedentota bacterium]|nr:MAG: hypothetical protein D6767_00110 [Candidatus Hydrogenedentota bacterium]